MKYHNRMASLIGNATSSPEVKRAYLGDAGNDPELIARYELPEEEQSVRCLHCGNSIFENVPYCTH